MRDFITWLSLSDLSIAIGSAGWAVPLIQCFHIVAVGALTGALLVFNLKIAGLFASEEPLQVVSKRYEGWIWGAIILLALTGGLLIIAEPARELLAFSFWAKMTLLLIGMIIVASFQLRIRRGAGAWGEGTTAPAGARRLAVGSFVIWVCIMVLGRFIAWDTTIWGSWSFAA
ncbi:DUF6644 family protein [Pseudoroseicyclus tamaricis]|uniref:DUF6644 domain-containing protein n=1 Tax=Pseudoroseicyclus tamaricis TaxID=2705421 RepID=A0A6B2K4P1_9RHOB|nr:DUF6644 family protein [Pseudoroseicyclus tamaricis]NDV02822.1 hypothetical protein [Pseudoroseicyclus tamaricis]